jgi:hypothetical protein
MTYTAVNPHACCNRPRPEDAHAAARPPPHPHASPHLTNSDGLRWKTDGRPPANGPPTATPQQRRHSPSTPARGPPRPPCTPRPSPQPPPPPSQSQGQVPITEQNFLIDGGVRGVTSANDPGWRATGGLCIHWHESRPDCLGPHQHRAGFADGPSQQTSCRHSLHNPTLSSRVVFVVWMLWWSV